MDQDIKSESKYKWIIDSFGLLIASAVCYYLVFSYESGYCSVFNIPSSFIVIDLTKVLIWTTALFAFFTLLVMALDSFVDILTPKEGVNKFHYILNAYLPLLCPLLVLACATEKFWSRYWVFLVGILIYTIFDVVTALFLKKDIPFSQKLLGLDVFIRGNVFLSIIKNRFGISVLKIVLIGFYLKVVSFSLGESEAMRQQKFLIPNNQPNAVVAKIYGDSLICVGVDFSSKKPTNEIYLIKKSSDIPLKLEFKEIGRLSFDKK